MTHFIDVTNISGKLSKLLQFKSRDQTALYFPLMLITKKNPNSIVSIST